MAKGSAFGKRQLEEAWQSAEVEALYRLHAAGVRVPKPHLFFEGVLVMELVDDGGGHPAPRLGDLDFDRDAATEIHRELMRQVVLMLCASTVHGDLSEFNVLLTPNGPTIIDLPQAVDAAHNPNAKRLFLRDVENLTRFFASYAPELRQSGYGSEIWSLYERSALHPEVELNGRLRRGSRPEQEHAPAAVANEAATANKAATVNEATTVVRRRSVVVIEQANRDRKRPQDARRREEGAAGASRRSAKDAPPGRRGKTTPETPQKAGRPEAAAPGSGRRRRRRRRRPNDSSAAAS